MWNLLPTTSVTEWHTNTAVKNRVVDFQSRRSYAWSARVESTAHNCLSSSTPWSCGNPARVGPTRVRHAEAVVAHNRRPALRLSTRFLSHPDASSRMSSAKACRPCLSLSDHQTGDWQRREGDCGRADRADRHRRADRRGRRVSLLARGRLRRLTCDCHRGWSVGAVMSVFRRQCLPRNRAMTRALQRVRPRGQVALGVKKPRPSQGIS